MSIVASVKVHDGIVLGADSVSQIMARDEQGRVGPIKAYDNAQKLYQIRDQPIGVGTYGIGNIGPRSVGSFLLEFSKTKGQEESVESVAKDLLQFLVAAYETNFGTLPPDQKPELGLLIVGYSSNQPLAEEWEFVIPKDNAPKKVREASKFGASWRGISVPFTRLYRGLDPRFPDALKGSGVADEVIGKLTQLAQGMSMPIVFDGMPLQDAVDFVSFILRTTIGAARFEVGIASCGGPLWVAVITRDNGFSWIHEPKLILK